MFGCLYFPEYKLSVKVDENEMKMNENEHKENERENTRKNILAVSLLELIPMKRTLIFLLYIGKIFQSY